VSGVQGGVVLILAAVALIETWRRGLLKSLIDSFTEAAKDVTAPRPFRFVTAPESYVGNDGAVIAP
jgi:hypothetical protein